jgi:O-antigen ligase
LVLLGGFGDVLVEFLLRGQSPEGIRTLSGRVDLWRVSWDLFAESPWIGQGAFSATRFAVAEVRPWGDIVYSAADNVIVEVITGVGILGLVPFVVCIAVTWRTLWRSLAEATGLTRALLLEAVGVLTIMSVRALFTSGPFIWHPALPFLAILCLAEWVRRRSALTDPAR